MDRLPAVLAAATVGLQIPYPLATGETRQSLTILSVLMFAAASASHAVSRRGAGWTTGYLIVTVGGGLLAETVGVRTGWPFGSYAYTDTLGLAVVGVPVVVPLAWAMMAYPVLVFCQYVLDGQHVPCRPVGGGQVDRLRRWAATAGFGGLLLAAWDLFLDPQMVDEGHWVWLGEVPSLNGIPLSNAAGWVLVGTCLVGLLTLLPPQRRGATRGDARAGGAPHSDDAVPFVLLGWTYFSSVLANLAFFGRPAVALAGGTAMGTLLAAGLSWRRRHPPA